MARSASLLGLLVAGTLLQASCGDDENASSLTCSVLANEDNCWASAAIALSECLPPSPTGMLSADRTSCAFANGSVVRFDAALPNNTSELERLAFTIERGGQTCGRFVDTFQNRMEMTTSGATVVAELRDSGSFVLECPGGPSYSAPFDSLFDCAAMNIPPPTDGFEVTTDLVEFWISSIATPDALFTCTPGG